MLVGRCLQQRVDDTREETMHRKKVEKRRRPKAMFSGSMGWHPALLPVLVP